LLKSGEPIISVAVVLAGHRKFIPVSIKLFILEICHRKAECLGKNGKRKGMVKKLFLQIRRSRGCMMTLLHSAKIMMK
jgi:hypothetical protein